VKLAARSLVSVVAASCLFSACDQRDHAPGPLPAYVHTYEHSRFYIGNMISERDEFGMHKTIGDVGTFAVELVSKAAVGTRDDPFPDPVTGVYPGDADAQNAAVRSYFVSAGLPEDQVLSISANGTEAMEGGITVAGWYSYLHRGYGGVPIDNSMATAAFDASKRGASEQVYWPEIPVDVLEQVRAFQDMLADPVQKADYIQKLPASARTAELVIRHTSWFWQGTFEARACCRGASSIGLCFDMSGHPIQLVDEMAVDQ